MSNNNYRDYKLQLLANQAQSIGVNGDYWQVIQAVAGVMLTFDDTVPITRYQGMGGPARYGRVTISSAVDQEVIVALGLTEGRAPYDSRGSSAGGGGGGGTITGTVNVSATVSTSADVACAAGAATLLKAANANRIRLTGRLPDTAASGCRIGDSAVGVSQGLPLKPGEPFEISTKAAVYLYNVGGVSINVPVLEENS